MKTSHPPIRRMIYIDQQLRDRKYPTCRSIASEFEVNRKTIFRDIEYMRYQLDAPIAFDFQKNGYYYTQSDYFLPAIHLKESDLLSIIINERILSQYRDTPYHEEIKRVIEKILCYLPDDVTTEHLGNFVSFKTAPASAIERHKFEILQQAILKHEQLSIKYQSQHRDQAATRRVNPLLLHNHHGNWYLVAHCLWRKERRIFAVNRILAIERTGITFEPPEDLSIDQILKDSFNIMCGGDIYHVKLKFSPYQARWIRERQWHKTQRLTELDSGGLIFEMDVQGLSDVKRWVMQYGAEVEVLEPEELRREIIREIGEMTARYSK
ncbi:WYL domain-containing protein [candidate division KSB1 bacterium]|nr:WYL domain-containing protein [candidate division KSB1 bacterium]